MLCIPRPLPSQPPGTMQRVIAHLNVDVFYASVEPRDHPDLI